MRVAFAGTPEFAATALRGLLASDHEVGLVISQPDARRGRGRKTSPTPVAELARNRNVPLRQPERISEAAAEISAHDVLVVAAYGQILRPDTLHAAPNGALNVHASILPRYRGAAPVERAIMAGETESGVSIMQMDEDLDTGPVALQRKTSIPPDMTGGELTAKLAELGANAMVEVLGLLEAGNLNLTQQNSLYATYAPKITAAERFVDWERGAEEVRDLVRALSPHVGARASHPAVDGPVRILRSEVFGGEEPGLLPGEISTAKGRFVVGCGEGALEVLELQAPGRRPMGAREFLRGTALGGAFRRR